MEVTTLPLINNYFYKDRRKYSIKDLIILNKIH
jgi:hypothetical protein